MKLEYVSVKSGAVLDTITVNGDDISYDTGLAEDVMRAPIKRYGSVRKAVQGMKSWSNGYVRLREVPNPPRGK